MNLTVHVSQTLNSQKNLQIQPTNTRNTSLDNLYTVIVLFCVPTYPVHSITTGKISKPQVMYKGCGENKCSV